MLTPKQEAFVLAYIEIGNASEAYKRAYNAAKMKAETVRVKASELLKNGNVTVRLSELQKKHAERHEVTVDSLVSELEEARELAKRTEAPAAMVAATMGKAKITGKIVDKSEIAGQGGGPVLFTKIERVIVYPPDKDRPSIPPPAGNA
jgi:phage terminase small subunit